MFTCENCHQQKSDRERITINRWGNFVLGVMAPREVSIVCQRCSGRVKRLGYVAIIGLLLISVVTVLVLNYAANNM